MEKAPSFFLFLLILYQHGRAPNVCADKTIMDECKLFEIAKVDEHQLVIRGRGHNILSERHGPMK